MRTYSIMYCRREHFPDCSVEPESVTLATVKGTHVEVGARTTSGLSSLDEIYLEYQGEHMDPAEAQRVGELAGHTSMSVGDALLRDDGVLFVCIGVGWKEVRRATTL
jgi:hypothetical protein